MFLNVKNGTKLQLFMAQRNFLLKIVKGFIFSRQKIEKSLLLY